MNEQGAGRPRRLAFAVAGLGLALGAPLGLLIVRLLTGRAALGELGPEWSQEGITYAYVALSTAVVFAWFGAILGEKADLLERQAVVDPLTRLLNRRGLAERLEQEVARARRYEHPLSLLMVDLDHLKEINDRRGHYAGDSALRQVATALGQGSRSTDWAGRWGGDEFLLIAPSTGPDAARVVAERIRQLARGRGDATPLSVSVGVATWEDGDLQAETLLAKADAALYQAKQEGRNRVVSA
jgi:diguanylate cyclase (GGDEF)-like protein